MEGKFKIFKDVKTDNEYLIAYTIQLGDEKKRVQETVYFEDDAIENLEEYAEKRIELYKTCLKEQLCSA